MANVVKFNMKQVPAAISQMFVRVTDLDRNSLFEGEQPVTGASVEIDIGAAGTDGQGVLIHGDNYQTGNESTFKGYVGYGVVETSGVDPTPTFEVDKIVTVSASIINQSTNESTVSFLEPYIQNKYGKTVALVNESISGEDIADLRARCDALFDKYANESNTRILLHYGGGNINPSSTFLDQGQSTQDAMIADLNYVYDSAEQRGVKIMQAALTFRNYDGTTLQPTPAEQEAYALGSYTYTRDWIVPIMKQRTPELLDANDWPIIDFYNLTRNHVHEWLNPYDELDKVHPSDLGRIIISKYYVDSIIAMSLGAPLPPLPQRDFNVAYADATTPIDFVTAFGRDLVIDGNTAGNNINWVSRARPPVAGTEPIFIDGVKDVNGNPLNEVKVYSWANDTLRDGEGNLSDPTNNTTSLLNSTLLKSCLNVDFGSGSMYLVVEGLEPNKWYEASFNAGGENDSIVPRNTNIQVTDEDNEPLIMNCQSSPPEVNLVISNFVTNSYGEALIASSEENENNNSVIGGFRIKTI